MAMCPTLELPCRTLAQTAGLDNHTVEKCINILEKAFVIFRVGFFSRNLRNELKKSNKFYFYDNGIRNAVIAQFTPWEMRQDNGALWENYLMAERKVLISPENCYQWLI